MSTQSKKLNQLIDEQQAILNSIKSEALMIDSDALSQENENLKKLLDNYEDTNRSLYEENEKLKKELSTAKTALFTKIANEKLSVFKSTQKKLEKIYYRDNISVTSRLNEYENNCIKSIDTTVKTIKAYGSGEFDEILEQLNTLRQSAFEKRRELEQYKNAHIDAATKTNFAIGDQLKNEPLTELEKQSALKQKSIESFIGLNVLGKAGILLFIVGIVMLGRFAYIHMSDVFKGGMIYLLGAVLVAIGELFYKKEKTVFSTTLISGGVATLYAAAATCYFAFNLYNVKITFVICIAITALAIILSHQVKSQVVCGFAAVGGYLPVVALYMIGFGKAAADVTFLPVSSIYFCLLAVILFGMTYNKKWYAAQFIGYALHLIAIGGVAKCATSLSALPDYDYVTGLAVAFSIVSFVIYMLMPGAKIFGKRPITVCDSVLLALNTLSGAISVSVTVNNLAQDDSYRLMGFVFLGFAVLYALLMSASIKEKKQSSGVATIITSLSALVFSMLVVPLIFGIEYAGISWAVEGVIIAVLFQNKGTKLPEIAGIVCMVMSVIALFSSDLQYYSVLFVISLSIILSAFWIYAVCGIINSEQSQIFSILYSVVEIITAYSTAGFGLFLFTFVEKGPIMNFHSDFTKAAVGITCFLIISVILRLGILKNTLSTIASDIAGLVIFVSAFVLLDIGYSYYDSVMDFLGTIVLHTHLEIFNLVALIVINILVELFFALSVLDIINKLNAPAWTFTLAISVSLIMLSTATIMNQFSVKFSNVILSAVYVAVACVLLFIGFKKQYTVVRSGGLVLVLCAFAKLCFVDTSALDSGWKIASYFAFGAILIIISFFYQRFSKMIEKNALQLTEQEEQTSDMHKG